MRATPADLVELRRLVVGSYQWRTPTRAVAEAEWLAMTDTERSRLNWRADERLIEKLVEAEQQFTATFGRG